MIKIDKKLLDQTTEKAKAASRNRMNHNFHKQSDDLLQRMLNAMEPGTYIRPHKHENPDKREAFVIIRGRVAFIEFDRNGRVVDHIVMDAAQGCYGLEIAPRCYHTLISLQSGSVLYEVKDGPYNAETDKNFASWAPEEGSNEASMYLTMLIDQLKLS